MKKAQILLISLILSFLFFTYSLVKAQSQPQLQVINDIMINEGDLFELSFQASDEDELNKIDNPTVVVIGSSTASGTGASSREKQWVSLFEQYLADNTSNYQLFRQARGGYTSYHFRENGFIPSISGRPLPDESVNITAAILNNPDLIIVNLPSNDVSRRFDDQETYDNFLVFKNLAESTGSKIVYHTNQPVNYSTFSQRQQLFNKSEYIKANFGPDVIETYDLLADPVTYNIRNEYNSDDVHVNNAGHQIIFEQTAKTLEKYIIGDEVTFEVSGLPPFAEYEFISDGKGKIIFSPNFLSSGVYPINIIARDLQGNTDSQSFTLTVNDKDPIGGTQRLESFNHTVNNGGVLDYYIYFPEDYDLQPNNQPVLISLHGNGERDGDPSKMLGTRWGDGSHAFLANQGYNFPLVIVSPHQQTNVGGVNSTIWNSDLVKQLIDHIISTYNIDPARIYLTGFSNGGQAAWQYATRYPETIAALVPMAGRTPNGIRNRACDISSIPTRTFHGDADNIINESETIEMVNRINNCNPTPDPLVELNIIPGINHDDLRPLIYKNISGDDNIYDWMLSFEKGGEVVDNDPPIFLNETPIAENILDTSFELRIELNERSNIYVAAFTSNYIPTSDEVKLGIGNQVVFSSTALATNSFTFSYSDLTFDTEYNVWIVAEDNTNPNNLQALPEKVLVRTQPEIIDVQSPVFEDVPYISELSAGSFKVNLDIDESGTIFWGLYPTGKTPTSSDLINGINSIQYGSLLTDGSVTSFDIGSLFKNSDYTLALIAQDIADIPNIQENITFLNVTTLEFDEGVVPNKIYKINATNGTVSSGLNDWNDINFTLSGTNNKVISDTQGSTSTLSITTYNQTNQSFYNNVADNGSNYGGNIMPPSIIRYTAWTSGKGKVDINGLDPNKFYTLKMLASRSGGGSRLTNFLVNGSSRQLESVNNKDNIVSYEKISPNGSGKFFIEFTKVNSSWGYFNGMIIEEFNKLSGDITSPESISNLTYVFDQNNNSVNLTWTASPDTDVTSYTVYRSRDPNIDISDFNKIIAGNISTTSFSDVSIDRSQIYYYAVLAVDNAGNFSEISEIITFESREPDLIPPTAPIGLVSLNISASSVELGWEQNQELDIKGYSVYRSNTPSFDIQSAIKVASEITSNTFQDTGLNDGTFYYYRVTAIDRSDNESIASDELSVFTNDVTSPLAPESISLIPSVNDITIEWSPSTSVDVDKYEIYRIDTVEQEITPTPSQNPIGTIAKNIYLSFENNIVDGSGNNVSSNLRNGTSFSSEVLFDGQFSAQFDGINDFIDIDGGNQFIHAQFTQRTISLWIFPETTSGIRDIFDEGGSTNGIGLRINNGKVEAAVQNQQVIRTISADINANEWTLISLIFDNGQLNLYINGQLASNDPNIPFSRVDAHGNGGGLGGTNSSNAFDIASAPFQGFIDEFVITGAAWDADFISSYFDYNNPDVIVGRVPVISLLGSVEDDTFSFIDTSVEPNVDYSYYVTAVDVFGNISSESDIVSSRLIEEILIPSVPQGLIVELVQQNQALLQWNAVNTSGFKDYSVYRSSIPFNGINEAELIASGLTETNYLDISLESESTYYYAVLANNVLDQLSPLSEVVSLTTTDFEAPLPPIEISAIYDEGVLVLTWNPSRSVDASLYRIYRGIGISPQISIDDLYQELDASVTSYDDIDIDESITYHYIIVTIDDVGNESVASEEIQVTIPNITPPSIPLGVTLSLDNNNDIIVSWTSNLETDLSFYTIWRSVNSFSDTTEAIKVGEVSLSQLIDSDLMSSTQYFYRISATDNNGNVSELSSEVNIITEDIDAPATPQGLSAIAANNLITTTWNANIEADLASYQIYRGTTSDFTISTDNLIGEVQAGQSTELITAYFLQEEGTAYYIKITATDLSDNSSETSTSVQVTIPNITPPSIPLGLSLTLDGANEVRLDWNNVSDQDILGYNIYRSTESDLEVILSNKIVSEVSVNEYLDLLLDFNTTYYYVITSIDLASNESEASQIKFITTEEESTGVSYLRTFKLNITRNGINSGLGEWNDLSFNLPTRTTAKYLLNDSTNNSSNVGIEIDNGINGSLVNSISDNGSNLNGGVLPNPVLRYAAYTTGKTEMRLTGLNIENLYEIIIHSGRSGSGSRISKWTVQGVESSLEVINNKDNLLRFNDISPNSSGEISITLNKVNSSWAYFNGMILREYSNSNSNSRLSAGNQLDIGGNIAENKKAISVIIYPNPTTRGIFIKTTNFVPTTIRVYNQSGILYQDDEVDNIDNGYVINQRPGLYLIQLSDEFGTTVYKKVTIE